MNIILNFIFIVILCLFSSLFKYKTVRNFENDLNKILEKIKKNSIYRWSQNEKIINADSLIYISL